MSPNDPTPDSITPIRSIASPDITAPAAVGSQANGAHPPVPPLLSDAPIPGARLALIVLLSINLFNYIDRQVLAANLPSIEKQLLPPTHLLDSEGHVIHDQDGKEVANPAAIDNDTKLGNLAFAFMVAYMLFAPLFGWLADRFSRWKLVGIGVILWSLASGASAFPGTFGHAVNSSTFAAMVGTFGFLLLTRCFVGIGEAAYGPVAPSVISDLFPIKRRGSVLAWFYAAIPVGSALGYLLGGAAGWPWSFYLVVPPGLLLGAWCFFLREPKRGQTDLAADAPARHAGVKDYFLLLKNPSFVLNTLGMTALTFALGGIGHFMPKYICGPGGEGVERLQSVNTIFGIIVVVSGLTATIIGGIAGDKLRPYFAGSYFLVSAVAMLIAFPLFLAALWLPFRPFPWAWICIFWACFFLFFNTGPTNTILANVTHPSLRAPAFALNIFIIHAMGDAISPTVIGMISASFPENGAPNLRAGFVAVSIMVLLGGIFWLMGIPFLERDTAQAPYQLDRKPS
jgi:MFS transporter, Spinster family, sphingosine-1-phosphate transporter